MIVWFKDADTEALAGGLRVKRPMNTGWVARRKLRRLQIAGRRRSLATAPGSTILARTTSTASASSANCVRPGLATGAFWGVLFIVQSGVLLSLIHI